MCFNSVDGDDPRPPDPYAIASTRPIRLPSAHSRSNSPSSNADRSFSRARSTSTRSAGHQAAPKEVSSPSAALRSGAAQTGSPLSAASPASAARHSAIPRLFPSSWKRVRLSRNCASALARSPSCWAIYPRLWISRAWSPTASAIRYCSAVSS